MRISILAGIVAWLVVAMLCTIAAGQAGPGQEQPASPQAEPAGDDKEKKPPKKKEGEEQKDKKEKKDSEEKEDKGEEQGPRKFTKEQIEKAYPVGERLTYNVSWKGIHAGTAVLEVTDKVTYKGRKCFRIRSYTRSAKVISLFYKVDDRLQSYIDAETLEPLRSDKRLREGGRQSDQFILFSPAERTAEYHKRKKGRFVLRRAHTKVPPGVQDVLSSIYALRTMKLEVGQKYSMPIITGRRITTGAFEITEEKKIKIPDVGKFVGVKITPRHIEVPGEGKMKPGEGLFVASGDSDVWLDKATGMPLRMYVDVPLGAIKVELCKKEMVEKKDKPKEGQGK